MKIQKTYIEDNKLYITLDKSVVITKIYLDSVSNKCNMYSEKDEDHTNAIIDITSKDNINYIIDITNFKEPAFIVTVIAGTRTVDLSIDLKLLYYAKVNMLLELCNTCLDNDREYKIILCELRSNLLEYTLAQHLLNDAIQHYIDLTRILEISNGVKHELDSCKNGYCAL